MRLGRTKQVAGMGEMNKAYTILAIEPEGRRPLRRYRQR
jgi:hypothetical protein